jgi:hypothetical protein
MKLCSHSALADRRDGLTTELETRESAFESGFKFESYQL